MPADHLALARDVAAVARERQVSVAAAGLAYHTFNALVPLVILALVAAALVDGLEPLLGAVESAAGLEGTMTDAGIEEVAGDGGDRIRAAVLASAVLLWSAFRLFRAVNGAFTDVYGHRDAQVAGGNAATVTLLTVANAALATATVALGVAFVSVVGVSLSIVAPGIVVAAASAVALVALLLAVLFPMYYLFPRADVSAREVLPGTALAAVTWTALAVGFRIYVATSESVALFGIAGAILLILTWVYLGALCLVLGAVLNAVLGGYVEPESEWVPMRERWPVEIQR